MEAIAEAPQPADRPPSPPAAAMGTDSFTSIRAAVLQCNKDGMEYLRRGELRQAFQSLKRAETQLTTHHAITGQADPLAASLYAVTCNNLGCYFKRAGKLHNALSYLRRSLQIEEAIAADAVTTAGTHLNVCAILSKLTAHREALQHASTALTLVRNRVIARGKEQRGKGTASTDEYMTLAIAYHNVAVEHEFLGQLVEAATAFAEGHQVALSALGPQHPLTRTLGNSAEALTEVHGGVWVFDHAVSMVSSFVYLEGSLVFVFGRPFTSAGDEAVALDGYGQHFRLRKFQNQNDPQGGDGGAYMEVDESGAHQAILRGGRVGLRLMESLAAAENYSGFRLRDLEEHHEMRMLEKALRRGHVLSVEELHRLDTLGRAEESRRLEELERLRDVRRLTRRQLRQLEGAEGSVRSDEEAAPHAGGQQSPNTQNSSSSPSAGTVGKETAALLSADERAELERLRRAEEDRNMMVGLCMCVWLGRIET
uniref:MalT-like TPR region domain-containing protein n=1 Tax=Chromera velia CCMP2878 TaxID=1169474 RepID=A0A0G4HFH3_9ALVE|eukprot:Cvel_26946.t1-p1 / transcript=Cvel_26946.t1 / gene=Cvel_26946 / organism=Chromera_velia_CCMP2878 / gene_product=hypothetical protein / transcript_product=hypothetical protein / location=Cvel_scaffold3282:13647-18269(+) / protein_length=481 / sequence_SO=supercontig / SO=protein_coding / is_pseudo=false